MKFCIAVSARTSPTVPVPLGGDFAERMEYAGKLGYDAIEIHVPDCAQLDVPGLLRTRARLGVAVATLGTGTIYGSYGLSLVDPDAARRRALVERVKEFIDCAAKLDSRVTVGSIKGNIARDADRDERLGYMGQSMAEISAYAAEKGVTVLLEATNRYENNVLNTAGDVRRFIEKHRLANTLILLDAFHANIEEGSVVGGIRDAGGFLGHVHFADNNRQYPGAGCFRFEDFNTALRQSGYDGYLSVECLPLPDGAAAAEKSMAFFRRHFGK